MKSRYFLIFILLIDLLYAKEVLTFSKAYQLGLLHSHQIKSSFYQLKAIEAKIKQQESALYPHLSLSATLSKQFNKLNQEREDNTTKSIEFEKSLSINFTQVVYDASLKVAIEVGKKQAELSSINHFILKQNYATEVLKKYLKILNSKNRIVILKSYRNYYSSLLKLAKRKFKFNLIDKMELLHIEVELEKTKLQIKKEKELLKSYKKSLFYLIGTKEDSSVLSSGKMRYVTNTHINTMLKTVQNFTFKNDNLQYKKAKKGIELMERKIEEAKSARFPKVNFRASYTKYFSNGSKTATYYKNRKAISLQLSMPIYQGGAISSKIEEAKLNKLAALEDTINIHKDIEIEYEEELSNFKYFIESIKLYKKAYRKAKLYYRLAKKGYKSGIKSLIDVYDAKTKVNEAKFKYMQNLYDMIASYVKLLILKNDMDKLVLIDKIIK